MTFTVDLKLHEVVSNLTIDTPHTTFLYLPTEVIGILNLFSHRASSCFLIHGSYYSVARRRT